MTWWWKRSRSRAASAGEALDRLISIASPPLCAEAPRLSPALLEPAGDLAMTLVDLLTRKNGFFAFESALHLYPAGPAEEGYDLAAWNQPDLWRHLYGDLTDGFLFFAQDVFGDQFALREGRVYRFHAETGEAVELANDLHRWAARLLTHYRFETAYPLAHAWQQQYGRLRSGERLIPRVLFMLGGDYSVENLVARDAALGMQIRGPIAALTRHVPDGARIRLRIVE
jgi:hypothetical protein